MFRIEFWGNVSIFFFFWSKRYHVIYKISSDWLYLLICLCATGCLAAAVFSFISFLQMYVFSRSKRLSDIWSNRCTMSGNLSLSTKQVVWTSSSDHYVIQNALWYQWNELKHFLYLIVDIGLSKAVERLFWELESAGLAGEHKPYIFITVFFCTLVWKQSEFLNQYYFIPLAPTSRKKPEEHLVVLLAWKDGVNYAFFGL